ncbi:MAG: 6,7-dimethyl-8-ribityllumazine synthase [Betaproteobacteria bacterium]|nr:6,7-dimethyl-8-ribityllumazine synthase [Betaproteobacteria bacterium]
MPELRFDPNLDGTELRIGLVVSRFNPEITEALEEACLSELYACGVLSEDVVCVSVPGALEIPLALEQLAETGQFDALVALGAVIRGETYHFELVCQESAAGVSRVGQEFHIPVANAILTTETDAQAEERAPVKGREAAQVAVEMANLLLAIDAQLGEDNDPD